MNDTPLLQMEHIRKEFPGVVALDDVSLTVKAGTVHALMGENGAGKSTLMKILIGEYKRTSGTILWEGAELDTSSITSVLKSGISMIFQELNPIRMMKVCEDVFVGREPYKYKHLHIDYKKLTEDTQKLFDDLEIKGIDPNVKMGTLSTAQMQMVEIAKAISYNAKLIIMDEPTSSITENECEHLFRLVRRLKKQGIAFIFITHKVDEVYEISDEITILRDGTYVGTYLTSELNENDLVHKMVGRRITNIFPKEDVPIGDVKLKVSHMTVPGVIEDISFDVRKGEILGFSGLVGAGRSETMETLFGLRRMTEGTVEIDGKKVTINSPKEAIRHGMAFLTEDRRTTGCFLPLDVKNNIMICAYDQVIRNGAINPRLEEKLCEEQIEKYAIKTPGLTQKMMNLSGGNQQKVLIARWLLPDPDIIILDEPTRGIDVGSKSEIHKMIVDLARRGKSIIMISSEMPEVLGMSDRVVVMYEGHITGILERDELDQDIVMRYASGLTDMSTVASDK